MNGSAVIGWLCCVLVLASGNVLAQSAAPAGTDRTAFAARRFPQPVRVGDLLKRTILVPVESRDVLGHVEQVIKLPNGEIDIVMSYGGYFGFGRRSIAVPTDAMALLGSELEVLDFTPQQLDALPSYNGGSAIALQPDEIIRMGLAHPSH